MAKSVPLLFLKSIPPGARWITVHPNGKEAKGQPVLVQPEKNGTYRVIGGAGGKLNFLKLRGVRSETTYKQEAAERAKNRRDARKVQRKRDKDNGVHDAKQAARKNLKTQKKSHEAQYIQSVATAMGWDQQAQAFNEEDYPKLSKKALDRLRNKHHRKLLKRANKAVELQRQQLLVDAEDRLKNIGEIPLDAQDTDTLSVNDLNPIKESAGLGYATDYKNRAEEKGLTADELEAEKAEFQVDSPPQNGETTAETLRKELEGIREPRLKNAKAQLLETRQAVDLLKAQKKLKSVQAQVRRASKDVDKQHEPKAYVLEVGEVSDRAVLDDLQNDLRTLKTRAFLSEVGKTATDDAPDYETVLGRHIGVGAYNSINALSLSTTGNGLVGRDAVDVLGVSATAQVLARRLHNDLSKNEIADITTGLENFHLDHYLQTSESSLEEAEQWQALARDIELDAATDGHDLVQMQELNTKRREAIAHSNRLLGTALGEMEANAALIMALKQTPKDQVQVSLGGVSIEDAIRRARAIGLERGDYQIERVGANTFLSVQGSGLDRLAKPVKKSDLQQIRRNIDIIEGQHDEENWLPLGVANRPDLVAPVPTGTVPRLAEPFTVSEDIEQSIKDYIGGRTADGDPSADILADLQSQATLEKVGNKALFFKTLDTLAPQKDEQGKRLRAESHQVNFEALANEFVKDRYGQTRQPLHKQSFSLNQNSVDALHRALTHEPTGTLAYKPVADLNRKDQGHLRNWFYQHVASKDEAVADLRTQLETLESRQPEKEVDDMFGTGINPEWQGWKQQRDTLAENINKQDLSWSRYAKIMGGPVNAYATVQDLVRSKVAKEFQNIHNKTNPDAPLKLGRTVVKGNLNHLDAVDKNAREQREKDQRSLIDSLRERTNGRYAAGQVGHKLESARETQAAIEQSQMGFFSTDELHANEAEAPNVLKADERYTLGQSAERQIASMMDVVGKNFQPNKPTKLWQAAMNGKYINQQRAVKLIDQNKRLVLAQGVGSGKTMVMLSGFTHLKEQGKVKKGLFVVPSIVQGQFSGEALRYLEPGKFNWHIEPGASRASRLQSYKDPENHFSVVTHQSFRDDMLHLGAQQAGIDRDALNQKIEAMKPEERHRWLKDVMKKEGINWDYLAVDEGHDLLNRAGKKNSMLANVVDSLSASTEYYVNASADPVKNSPDEVFDLLHKMDPKRYTDQDAFMRRYGVDTASSQDELRRELARYFYPGKIESGVASHKKEITVPLSSEQQTAIKEIQHHLANGRLARMKGEVDIAAMKALSPHSFEKSNEQQHTAIAKRLQRSLGIIKHSAIQKVIDAHPKAAKLDKVMSLVDERKGKPGVIFARSLDTVRQLAEQLKKQGHKVVTITGSDSAKEKENKRLQFRPEQGEAKADILLASDAGAVG
ncbi:MAG TPA: hypothetical protein ENJ08_13900, partial [Gammaproteobacteria bacterium]|nr:hypothetical protein [Gammaproteobacteria bacterium]